MKRALYLSLHREIKLTFSAENSRLIFFRNFSISVPQLCLENYASICCTKLYGQFLISVPAQKSVLYGTVRTVQTVRNTYDCTEFRTDLENRAAVSILENRVDPVLYGCLDLRVDFYCMAVLICVLYGLNSGRNFQPTLSRFACKKFLLGFVQIPNSEICPLSSTSSEILLLSCPLFFLFSSCVFAFTVNLLLRNEECLLVIQLP